ncbi:hypothetical protein VPH35_043286 [Triticum aestivum]
MISASTHAGTNSRECTIQSALHSSFEQCERRVAWTLGFVRKTSDLRPRLMHKFQFLLPPDTPRAVQLWSELQIVEFSEHHFIIHMHISELASRFCFEKLWSTGDWSHLVLVCTSVRGIPINGKMLGTIQIMSILVLWQFWRQDKFKGSGRCRPEQLSVVPGARIQLVVLISFEYCHFKFQPDWILLIRPPVQERTSEVKFPLIMGKCILICLKIQDRIIVTLIILGKCIHPSAAPFERYHSPLSLELISHVVIIKLVFWAWITTCVVMEVDPIASTAAWEHFCCQKLISTWSYHLLLDYKFERIIKRAHLAYLGMVDSSPARMCIPTILEEDVQCKMFMDPSLDSVYTIGIECSYFPCHILSGLPWQASELDVRPKVAYYSTIVHLALYLYQPCHTEIMKNFVMTLGQQHISNSFYGLSSSNGSSAKNLPVLEVCRAMPYELMPYLDCWMEIFHSQIVVYIVWCSVFLLCSDHLLMNATDLLESGTGIYRSGRSWDPGGLALLLLRKLTRRKIFHGGRCAMILVARCVVASPASTLQPSTIIRAEVISKRAQAMSAMVLFTCSDQEHSQGGRGVSALAVRFTQGSVDHKYYIGFNNDYFVDNSFGWVAIIHYYHVVQVNTAFDCHHGFELFKDHQVQWDPCGRRLGVKPTFKEGGMLGASPTSTWACPWTCTWAWAMLDYLYYKYPGVGNREGHPVDHGYGGSSLIPFLLSCHEP